VRSGLSPYLHFGQISPIEIALSVQKANVPQEAAAAFLEQLIVRRELAMNFVWYTPQYDDYESVVPKWARKTLADHAEDERPFLYSDAQFEQAQTYDPYWNAAQKELLHTGSMHNYMRMYWGKKIIQGSPSPQQAFATMLRINNRYQLDGRDPNSFAGVAWCFGTHDRAWAERPIFGKVRYMNARGLERKFAIQKYVERYGG
jgi:deoxyribodipyrimidine photo-lyase